MSMVFLSKNFETLQNNILSNHNIYSLPNKKSCYTGFADFFIWMSVQLSQDLQIERYFVKLSN